jgi:hypothetical protein
LTRTKGSPTPNDKARLSFWSSSLSRSANRAKGRKRGPGEEIGDAARDIEQPVAKLKMIAPSPGRKNCFDQTWADVGRLSVASKQGIAQAAKIPRMRMIPTRCGKTLEPLQFLPACQRTAKHDRVKAEKQERPLGEETEPEEKPGRRPRRARVVPSTSSARR